MNEKNPAHTYTHTHTHTHTTGTTKKDGHIKSFSIGPAHIKNSRTTVISNDFIIVLFT